MMRILKRICCLILGLAVVLGALQAQNSVTVSDVNLEQGIAVASVELNNEIPFSAFQMDLKLPEGFCIGTTLDKNGDEVLDIALSDGRKKSSHTLSYNIFSNGTIRIVSFSSTNATYRGTSGEMIQIRIIASDGSATGDYVAQLCNIIFTTPEAKDVEFDAVEFGLHYSVPIPGVPEEPELPTTPINKISSRDLYLDEKEGSAVLSLELANETGFSAFQMDLKLPDGFIVATTINEDDEEVLDITLSEGRKKSTHTLSYNFVGRNVIRIASFSTTNSVYKGSSGEIVQFRIVPTGDIGTGVYTAEVCDVIFTTPEAVDYSLSDILVRIIYQEQEEIEYSNHSVTVSAGKYGRCIWEGHVIEPEESYTMSEAFEHGSAIKLYFVPFESYTASSMKCNNEVVSIQNNMYEGNIMEDVVFSDVNYKRIVDTMLVEKFDTLFVSKIEKLPIPVITYENSIVTITCEDSAATILYTINGNIMEEAYMYSVPFEVSEDAVVSAVAVKTSEVAELSVSTGVSFPQLHVVSQRYYTEDGVEISSPIRGITIVVVEYENGTTRVYKMLRK